MRSDRFRVEVVLAGLLLLLGACGNDPGGGDTTSSTVSQPSTTTSLPADDSTSTIPSSTTSTSSTTSPAPGAGLATLPLVAEEVVASDDGISLVLHRDGAPVVRLWDQPTALAFMIGEDLVVAQGSTIDAVYPRRATGPILVFDPAGVRSLPLGDEGLVLFDAGVVDGRLVALATSRTGDGPDDTDERLLLVDLLTEERTDLGAVGGWESGVSQALVADEWVVLVSGGEGLQQVVVQSLTGSDKWSLPSGPEASVVATVKGRELVLLDSGFVGPDFTPTITLSRFTLGDGSLFETATLDLEPRGEVRIDGGFCFTAEWLGEALVCDQTYGGPLLIDVFAGTFGSFGDFIRGVLTVPRGPAPTAVTWPGGTATCQELEGNVPDGVDDFNLSLEDGLLVFNWGDGQAAILQVLNDPSCTPVSDAWVFLIAPNLDPTLLYRNGNLCDFYRDLQTMSPPPANLETVLEALTAAEDLCN